ncbi:MAG: hypothetical protein HFH21_15045 [Ruminococcus sp.]|jgi:hypothetical protein|nr:hypothetical protein [Ruminococcus sp.]
MILQNIFTSVRNSRLSADRQEDGIFIKRVAAVTTLIGQEDAHKSWDSGRPLP